MSDPLRPRSIKRWSRSANFVSCLVSGPKLTALIWDYYESHRLSTHKKEVYKTVETTNMNLLPKKKKKRNIKSTLETVGWDKEWALTQPHYMGLRLANYW